jgi:hypothetical protein
MVGKRLLLIAQRKNKLKIRAKGSALFFLF